jgi:hypothetical protein
VEIYFKVIKNGHKNGKEEDMKILPGRLSGDKPVI